MQNTAYYIQSYLKTIPTPPQETKRLFAIGMTGIVGVGKSTLAEALARRLGLYIASNDRIRRWLNTQGFSGTAPEQELLQSIAEANSKYLYMHHISHILDNDLVKFHGIAKQIAAENGAQFFIFSLTAPEAVILSRLRDRERKLSEHAQAPTLSRAGIEDYYKRKQIHAELAGTVTPSLVIDTSKDITTQVQKVVDYLKKESMID